MYVILGRQKLGGRRYGLVRALFSFEWPHGTKHLYLVSEFTSLFPGRIKLRKKGRRGIVEVLLKDDIYHYFFVNEYFEIFHDYENPLTGRICIDDWCHEASIARIGVDQYEKAYFEQGFHPELVIHDEYDPSFFSRFAGYTIIRVNTVQDEVDSITINYRCSDSSVGSIVMDKVLTHNYQDYWQAVIGCDVKLYYFILTINGRLRFFGVDGLDSQIPFRPMMKKIDIKWWHGTIYYSIFPDRYVVTGFNDDKQENDARVLRRYMGGKLKDILEKIPYLSGLGVEAIYFTPIYEAASYHGYDVIDHKSINEFLGDINDFKELVKEMHRHNMRVVLDIVVNHTSPCARMFREALHKGRESLYWDWYRFLINDVSEVEKPVLEALQSYIRSGCKDLPPILTHTKPFYESFFNHWGMAKLNHDNEQVIKYIIEVMNHWSDHGADGFRLDVGHALPDHALAKIYRKIMGMDKPVILEVMMGNEYFNYGKTADSSMNYDLRRYILDFFIYKKINAREFVSYVMKQYLRIGHPYAISMYNLLGSHDTPRIKTIAKNIADLKDAYTFLFLIHGSPSIYYGDEIGMDGGHDPYCRKPMVWDENRWDRRIYDHIKKLIKLRKTWDIIRYGFTIMEALDDRSFRLKRLWKNYALIADYLYRDKEDRYKLIEKHVIGNYTIRFVKL